MPLRWALVLAVAVATGIVGAVVASAVAWSTPPPLPSWTEADAVVAEAFPGETVTASDRDEQFLGRMTVEDGSIADPGDAFTPGAVNYYVGSGWNDDGHAEFLDATAARLAERGWRIQRLPDPAGALPAFTGQKDGTAILVETTGAATSSVSVLRATPRWAAAAEITGGLTGLLVGALITSLVTSRSAGRPLRRPVPVVVTGIGTALAVVPGFAFALLDRTFSGAAAAGPLWATYAAVMFLWLLIPAAAVGSAALVVLLVGEARHTRSVAAA